MKFDHRLTVPTDVASTWELLLDLPRIVQCMPGATIETFDGDAFTGAVKVKLGPMQVVYRGMGEFEQRDEDAHTVVVGMQAKESRGTGTAKATVTIRLTAAGAATHVQLQTDLAITGRPAQLGRGLLDDVATQIIATFADNLAREIRGDVPADTAPSADVLDVGGIGTAALLRRAVPLAATMAVLGVVAGSCLWARARRRRA